MRAKLLQSCLTLCNPMDCSPPGSSVHGILQARILKWVAVLFCRGSSQSRDRTHVSYVYVLAGRFFTTSATWETHRGCISDLKFSQPENDTFAHSPLIRTGHMTPCLMTEKVGKYMIWGGGST